MEQLISAFCNKLIQNHVISENDREVYEYCFSILFTSVLYYAGCIIIMYRYQCYLLPIIFLVTYMLLRSFLGGWHAHNICRYGKYFYISGYYYARETFI